MAVTLKIKRRASSGNAGSPSALKSGELAFNENTSDKLLYYGYGDDGSGNATSVVAVGGAAIPNAGLASSSVTINSNSLSLGGSLTLDTDDLGEGSTNQYFTNARARGAVSVTDGGGDGSLAYNSGTGVITYTGPSASEVRTHLSVTDNGGDGSLSYDSGTGAISYTGPSAAESRAHISATTATGVTYNSSTGVVALASIPNGSLTNSAVTVNSSSVSLGASITLDTDDVGEGTTNLYYTDTRSRAAISADTTPSGVAYDNGTGVISLGSIPNSSLSNSSVTVNGATMSLGGSMVVEGTASEVNVSNTGTTVTVGLPDDVSIANDLSVGGDLAVTGDLTVNGALTSLSTTEVKVEDKNILLGDTANPTDVTADGGGITLKGASDYSIIWVNSTNSWTFNQNINVTTGGLSIGGTAVINSSRVVSNLAITGSGNTIDNITIDGGTF